MKVEGAYGEWSGVRAERVEGGSTNITIDEKSHEETWYTESAEEMDLIKIHYIQA